MKELKHVWIVNWDDGDEPTSYAREADAVREAYLCRFPGETARVYKAVLEQPPLEIGDDE